MKRPCIKKHVAGLMAGAMLMSTVFAQSVSLPAEAKAKVALSEKSITVQVGSTKTLSMKNTKNKVAWSVKSGGANVTLTNKKKLSVTIKGKKAGNAVVVGKVGKKSYTCKVVVKAKAKKVATFTEDDVTYTVKNNVLTSVKVGRNVRTVVIPSNRGIKVIGEKVFQNNHYIKQVIIPSGVTAIRNNAFNECTDLLCVYLPQSLTSIGDNAFFECVSLKKVRVSGTGYDAQMLPDGLKTIGTGAFYECRRIETVTIPYSVESLGEYAFGACDRLEHVAVGGVSPGTEDDGNFYGDDEVQAEDESAFLEGHVTEIPDQCFQKCPSLTNVELCDGITHIGRRAFENDDNLQGIRLPDSVRKIDAYAFSGTNLASVALPRGLATVEEQAFSSLSMDTIELPAGLTNCAYDAFGGTQLKSYTVASGNPAYAAKDGVLYSADFKTLICYPSAKSASSYTVDARTTSLADHCFAATSEDGLNEVSLPSSLEVIGKSAFEESGIKRISIPSRVTSIGDRAFAKMKHLSTITIPDSVTSLGSEAFSGCETLGQAIIGSGVSTYGWGLFADCINLTKVNVSKNVTAIDATAFSNCTGLKSFKSVTFQEGGSLQSDEEGNLVSSDGKTFYIYGHFVSQEEEAPDLSSMTEEELSAWLKDHPGYLTGEHQNENLHTYRLPDTVTSIGANAFYSGSGIGTLVIPDSVTTIGKNAYGYTSGGMMRATAIICSKNNSAAKTYASQNDIACFDRAVVGDTVSTDEQKKSLAVGKTAAFTVNGLLSKAYFSTSNPKVATVSTAGRITAKGKGTTSVICTSGTSNYICRVTVTSGQAAMDAPIAYLSGYEFLKASTYDKWMSAYQDYNRKLSLDEQDYPATFVYSTNDYTYIKGAILGEGSSYFENKVRGVLGEDYHQYLQIADNLSMELRQAKLHKNTVIYSGTGDVSLFTGDYSRQSLTDLKQQVGKSINFANVTSTSVDHGVCANFAGDGAYATMLEFYAPKDKTPGTYISQFSAFESEKELLLDRNVILKVLDCGYREAKPGSEFSGEETEETPTIERYVKLQILR